MCDELQFVLGVGDKFLNDHTDRHNFISEADGLAGHEGAVLDVAFDDGTAEGADPEAFDFELGCFTINFAGVEFFEEFDLELAEFDGAFIFERAHRDDGETRIELRRSHGVASLGAAELLFEVRVSDALIGHDEACAELDA